MSVIRGKIQKYLGMTLDYTVIGISIISMLEYIDEILTAFNKIDLINSGTWSSAATQNIFQVDESREKLIPDKAKGFHNLVAKKLYTTNMTIHCTCTSVAFLTTRKMELDEEVGSSHEVPDKNKKYTTHSGIQ